jgi:hypothetical protein
VTIYLRGISLSRWRRDKDWYKTILRAKVIELLENGGLEEIPKGDDEL